MADTDKIFMTDGAGQEIAADLDGIIDVLNGSDASAAAASSYDSKDFMTEGTGRDIATKLASILSAFKSYNAPTAAKLASSKTIRTNLASTAAASFDGSSNVTPGVTGTLPAGNGGTGTTTGHSTVTTSTDTTSTSQPAHGGTFTAIDSVTRDGNGHVTKVNTKTVTVPSSAATTSSAGLMSASDKSKLDGVEAGANDYSLPLAASGTRGGIQVGYSSSGKNYAVQLSNEKAYVNVPWTDTTYSEATTSSAGLMSASDKSKLDNLELVTVTFILDGSTYATATALKGSTVSAPTSPSKTGYNFKGWSLTSGGSVVEFPYTVTGSTTMYAVFEVKALNDAEWSEIDKASQSGIASSLWAVGDTKGINVSGTVGTLSVSDTFYVYILGFNHNSTYEGTNTIHFGCFKTALSNGDDIALVNSGYGSSYTSGLYFNVNHWGNYNYGGWAASDIRYDVLGSTDKAPDNYGSARATSDTGYDASSTCATNPVAGTLMAALPSDLRAVMKPMTKYTDNVGNATNTAECISATVDYLPLLAEYEIQGARTYANAYEYTYQAQYDYYANGNSKIKYGHSSGSAAIWWSRSPYCGRTYVFCYTGTSGTTGNSSAYTSRALAPAFAV